MTATPGNSTGFWSGETLLQKASTLISPFDSANIDCASYTLTIGHQVYVSPDNKNVDPQYKTTQDLKNRQNFYIPPGQFAFLLTEEVVTVPPDAIAFISMKAGIKFRGLVNVSGFHVDPGYSGQLTFSVFNAGPSTVHLQQGQGCFLIWYAYLDRTSTKLKDEPTHRGLAPDLVSNISGQLDSLVDVANRVRNLEREQTFTRSLAVAIFVLLVGYLVRSAVQTALLEAKTSDKAKVSTPSDSSVPREIPTISLTPAPAK